MDIETMREKFPVDTVMRVKYDGPLPRFSELEESPATYKTRVTGHTVVEQNEHFKLAESALGPVVLCATNDLEDTGLDFARAEMVDAEDIVAVLTEA